MCNKQCVSSIYTHSTQHYYCQSMRKVLQECQSAQILCTHKLHILLVCVRCYIPLPQPCRPLQRPFVLALPLPLERLISPGSPAVHCKHWVPHTPQAQRQFQLRRVPQVTRRARSLHMQNGPVRRVQDIEANIRVAVQAQFRLAESAVPCDGCSSAGEAELSWSVALAEQPHDEGV
jgi:hypothetical protein